MILGVDVGGTYIKYAWLNEDGEIFEKGQYPTPINSRNEFNQIIDKIWHDFEGHKKGMTFSMPGTIDPETGFIIQGGSLRYHDNVSFKKDYESRYNTNVFIENDARCAALAELHTGSMRGIKDGLVLTFGTGVGGGVIIGGEIHRGYNLFAGEVSLCTLGDMKMEGADAFFGGRFSIVLFIEEVKKALNLEKEADGHDVFKLIEDGNQVAYKMFEEYCDGFVQQLFNFYLLLAPERIALGGGVSENKYFIKGMKKAVDRLHESYIIPIPKPNVVACTYFNQANVLGALYNFNQRKKV